jgi:hypothetical protein
MGSRQRHRRIEGVDVRQLIDFPLATGGSVYVEVDDREGAAGYVRAGRTDDLAAKAESTFEAALGVIGNVATGLVGQVRELGAAVRPDEVEVQFGIRFSGRVGAVIAATEGESQVMVKLRWTPSGDQD